VKELLTLWLALNENRISLLQTRILGSTIWARSAYGSALEFRIVVGQLFDSNPVDPLFLASLRLPSVEIETFAVHMIFYNGGA
jgi:hypothetical protein